MADCSSPLPVAAARRLGTTNPSSREGVSPRVQSSRLSKLRIQLRVTAITGHVDSYGRPKLISIGNVSVVTKVNIFILDIPMAYS